MSGDQQGRTCHGSHVERVYFDTSAMNYFVRHLDYESFIGTRDLQMLRHRELFTSPIALWELMLTPDDETSDFLVFSAQHLFSPSLLASPRELLFRYLEHAYPENRMNYSFFTDLPMGDIWRRMAADPSVKFLWNRDGLEAGSGFIRRLGTNLAGIVRFPRHPISDEHVAAVAELVNTVYECSHNDGVIPKHDSTRYEVEVLQKIAVLFILLLAIWRLDFDSGAFKEFWGNVGIPDTDLISRLIYFLENYPELFNRGPILEMSIMAYHQLALGLRDRGVLFDSMHMVYAPYMHTILSADEDFRALRDAEPHYRRKLRHVDEINLRRAPYFAPKGLLPNKRMKLSCARLLWKVLGLFGW